MATAEQTRQAHRALGDYRRALEEAGRHATGLADATKRAGDAGAKLQRYVPFPIAAIEWRGAPPVAEWLEGLEAIVPAVKAGLLA